MIIKFLIILFFDSVTFDPYFIENESNEISITRVDSSFNEIKINENYFHNFLPYIKQNKNNFLYNYNYLKNKHVIYDSFVGINPKNIPNPYGYALLFQGKVKLYGKNSYYIIKDKGFISQSYSLNPELKKGSYELYDGHCYLFLLDVKNKEIIDIVYNITKKQLFEPSYYEKYFKCNIKIGGD